MIGAVVDNDAINGEWHDDGDERQCRPERKSVVVVADGRRRLDGDYEMLTTELGLGVE
ncbi:hypothetical protein U1Q18_037938, partial [Sarracenia purpurea var. burkii]